MLTNLGVIISLLGIIFFTLIYIKMLRTRLFDKYFQIQLEESYNLDDLFPIKIKGHILPKVDYLDIPYGSLSIKISTKTIRGTIVDNTVSLELIQLKDRKKAIYLIKKHYTKAVKSYIIDTIKNKKEFIELFIMSEKQKQHMKKIACDTCKHKMQCEIAFTQCSYERKAKDAILNKGFHINTDKNYELDSLAN
ncbi:hypothetical protein SAMN05660297_02900 [Natronincola peptidivorans]|uniref:Uncharacterized protein n=1 Tax=Natronincola peptidivorans TaxID=426128 RepID=A0A1I0FRQ7_9FIRM|nr:hypothetical protein [Natronincola peptidivorans]SET60034.1 hypothetical protein SAMN05660297_02900 [Natronincola peptidivorans]